MSLERLNQLCLSMTADLTLRAFLTEAGITSDTWQALDTAVRDGASPHALAQILDVVDAAAEAAGLEPVTAINRHFELLPESSPGYRTFPGWRCPHPHPCAQGSRRGDPTPPRCPLTGEPLISVTVASQ